MHNYDANMSPASNRKLKQWQRNFITLHAVKINWNNSTDITLSVQLNGREWHLRRQASRDDWIAIAGWKPD